jgi:hypothetical protein
MALNIIFAEVSGDVVVTMNGSVNLSGLTFQGVESTGASGVFGGSTVRFAPASTTVDRYENISGTPDFGDNTTNTFAGSFTTTDYISVVNLGSGSGIIQVPNSYVNASPLSNSMTFTGVSFLTMGVTNGTYTYTWGTGLDADSITVYVGTNPTTPTPTPTITQTNTPTVTTTPTGTSSVTPTPTPTGTAAVTPTPSGTPAVTPTPTQTQTGTASVTPTPTGTAAVTPTPTDTPASTPTPTPTSSPIYPLTGISVNSQYAYTIGILGNFSGGSITEGGPANGIAPHPIYTDGDGVPYAQLNAITLGGFNGLNN